MLRRAQKALRLVAGVCASGDMAVAQNGTPNMSVNVAAGQAVIDGSENTVLQGSYIVTNDAVVNKAVAASDPTNPRNDLVIAKVQDALYSGGTTAWSIAVVTGTPAGSPVDPAIPNNAIPLARVRVDATVTTIVNAKITDLRVGVQGALFPTATGWTLWDSTAALKNIAVTDAGAVALRNPALTLPPSVGGIVPPGGGSVPIKIDDILVGTDPRYPAATAQITFLNTSNVGTNLLPTGFRHLLIEWYARGDTVALTTSLNLRFNNISTNTYDWQNQQFRGTAAVAPTEGLTTSLIQLAVIPAASATTNYFGSGEVKVRHYTGTVGSKPVIGSSQYSLDDSTNDQIAAIFNGKWRTTATAITRVDLIPGAGNFLAGSLFTLWGIP